MLSRTVIPENARIPELRPDEPKTVRSEHLVPRRLIPAGATVAALDGAREDVGSSLAASKRRLMVPKRLVPAGAQIGEASQVAAGTLAARPDVFSEAILNDASLDHRRTAADWLVSAAVHAAIVATIMAVPLFYTQVIDLNKFQTTYLAAPPIPAAPPPPLSVAAVAPRQTARKITPALTAKLVMPVAVPKAVLMTHEAPAAPPEIVAGIPGGVEGGIPGGTAGGIFGGADFGAAPPPPVVAPPAPAPVAATPTGPLQVGGDVKRPKILYRPEPEYPRLAKQARIQGDVEIDAVIDQAGNVVQAKVMDGPPMLVAAALQAVRTWKYEPTYLNGKPWPVELTLHVTFKLS
jgi:protein TonB